MGFAWSHTTYAEWHGIVFNFEDKWDLDYFLDHAYGARRISSKEAYNDFNCCDHIKIFSSRCLGSNAYRKQEIKRWHHDNK